MKSLLWGLACLTITPAIAQTAGAIYTNPAAPGPIYLQGDHTSVKFKHIYLAPVVSVR